ncbi:hypothetical protein [Porphyrobacter sp. YT40]|uniref:hypothetical protein n=1 Tax=Porphyrobacter sp. YT40 TaxID=2547601 RepID=UPI00114362DC|nr:hypothetical protein [Porphyrobacter sp. YT40]QDH35292.1 hypothetical protein E2E27_13775 [Porphyrobacter sp. YT40]
MLMPALTFALVALLTISGLVALAVITDTLMQARVAYRRLMAEGEALRAGLAAQAAATELRMRPARPAAAMVTPLRRPARLVMAPLPARAAA